MLRKHANDALRRAIKWEVLAKDNKAKGNIDLAIIAARRAKGCKVFREWWLSNQMLKTDKLAQKIKGEC